MERITELKPKRYVAVFWRPRKLPDRKVGFSERITQ